MSTNTVRTYSPRTALAALCVCFGLSYVLYTGYLRLRPAPEPVALPRPTAAFEAAPEKQVAPRRWVIARSTSLAERETRNTAEALQKRLDQLRRRLTLWAQRNQTLQTSDEGRRLAASREHLDVYAAMIAYAHPSEKQLADWEAHLTQAVQEIDQASASRDAETENRTRLELRRLDQTFAEALTKLTRQEDALGAMLSPSGGVRLAGDTPLLRDALETRRQELALEQEQAVAAEMARLRQEAARKLAAARVPNEPSPQPATPQPSPPKNSAQVAARTPGEQSTLVHAGHVHEAQAHHHPHDHRERIRTTLSQAIPYAAPALAFSRSDRGKYPVELSYLDHLRPVKTAAHSHHRHFVSRGRVVWRRGGR